MREKQYTQFQNQSRFKKTEARRKQFRVGPAKIGSSAAGASILGGSGGMVPLEILKISLFKMHIWRLKRVSCNVLYNEYLPSVADEILIVSKASVAIQSA